MTDEAKRDDEKRPDDDGFEAALEDLSKSVANFMKKAVEKSEELLSSVGLDDVFGGMDFPDEGPTGTRRKKTEKSTARREPVVDVFDEGDEVLIYVELPGVEEENLEIKTKDGMIHLKARAGRDTFEEDIEIPKGINAEPTYHFKNGILKIQLSKGNKPSL